MKAFFSLGVRCPWSHSKMPFSQDSPFVSKKDLSRSFFIANFYTPNVVLFSVTFNTGAKCFIFVGEEEET